MTRRLAALHAASAAIDAAHNAWRAACRAEDAELARYDAGEVPLSVVVEAHGVSSRAWEAYSVALAAGETALLVQRKESR